LRSKHVQEQVLETIQDFLESTYRQYDIFNFRGGRLVRGRLRAMTDDCLTGLRLRLRQLGWLYSFEDIDGEDYLTCTVMDAPMRRRQGLHLLLFGLTVCTTLVGGGDLGFQNFYQAAYVVAASLFNAAASLVAGGAAAENYWHWLMIAWAGLREIGSLMVRGIPFSFAVITILGSHEMGHYLMARRYGMNVTLPFFIPVPMGIGTLGAVIRIKSPLVHRRAVLDVGAAGPLTGAIVSIIFLLAGLQMSHLVAARGMIFGDSILTRMLTHLFFGKLPPGVDVVLHPFAFAGWLGLLITAINLMPIGQLDGGHIAYALFGRFQRSLAVMAFGMLVTLGVIGLLSSAGTLFRQGHEAYWPWLLFAVFTRSLMKPAHPPTLDDTVRLNGRRKLIGVACLVLLFVCFVPAPMIEG